MSDTPITNTLQLALEKRAAQRLDNDLAEMCKRVREASCLQNPVELPKLQYLTTEGRQNPQNLLSGPQQTWTPIDIKQLFRWETSQYGRQNYRGSTYMEMLREALLPHYIQAETQMLLTDVRQMKEKLGDYLNAQTHADDH